MKFKTLLPVLMAVLLLAACGKDNLEDDNWEPPSRPTAATQPAAPDPTEPEPTTAPTTPKPTEPQPTDPTWPEEEFNPPDEDHVHRFGSWRVGKKGTCIKEGYKVRSCDCGEMENKPYFGEHSYGEDVVKTEPTCTEPGEGVRICTLCDVQEPIDMPALGHDEVITPGTPATCTEDGVSDRIHCARCEEVIQENTVIEAEHIPVTVERADPTCTDFGQAGMEICERCGVVTKMPEVIDRLGHNLVDGVCSRCGHTCDHGVDPENPGKMGQNEQETGTGAVVEGTQLFYQNVTCDQCGETSKIVGEEPTSDGNEEPATE